MKNTVIRALFTFLLLQIAAVFAYPNGPGNLDLTFAGTGYAYYGFEGGPYQGKEVVVQPDGKILTLSNSNPMYARTGITRFHPDGTLDTSFGSGGKILPDVHFGFTGSGGGGLLLQPDGKIVFVGSMDFDANRWIALARYNTDGTLDPSFDGDGMVLTRITGRGSFSTGAALGPDGKIVVLAQWFDSPTFGYRPGMVRYNTDGSLDTSFDGDGQLTSTFVWSDVAVQADGKIVTSYSLSTSDTQFRLARYNLNGGLDASFDGDGMVTTPTLPGSSDAFSIVLLPDGRILAGGQTNAGSNYDFCIVRYHPDGSLDTSLNGTGTVITPILAGDDNIQDIAIQSDGKIVAAGFARIGTVTDMALVRYNFDGSLDSTYGSGGKAVIDLGFSEVIRALALDGSNKAVVVGGAQMNLVGRITSDYAPLVDVGGRVTSTNGQGISNATIFLTNVNNQRRQALTNAFGYYIFSGVPSNETYTVFVSAKRYRFQPPTQSVTLVNSVSDLDFTGNPGSESLVDLVIGGDKSATKTPGVKEIKRSLK